MTSRRLNRLQNNLVFFIAFVSLLCMAAGVFLLTGDIAMRLLMCGFAAVTAIGLWLMRFMARRQFIQFTENVCDQLDHIIEDRPDQIINLEEETLESKCKSKLVKIRDITKGNVEQSEQLKKHVQELVSDISHQLKTPLSNIKMAAETLTDDSINNEQYQFFISGLNNQVSKLEFLIESMTKISRLENGTIMPKAELSSIAELIELSITAISPMAKRKHIEITSETTDHFLYFDMRWTCEALFNILDNAVKYTPEYGKINITMERMSIYTRIDIRDTGIGILPQNINNIFKRFYRENRLRQADGVGVGLYVAREIVSRQSGYITAKSEPDKGTTVSVYLQNTNEKEH